jgi:hypothetical protein
MIEPHVGVLLYDAGHLCRAQRGIAFSLGFCNVKLGASASITRLKDLHI